MGGPRPRRRKTQGFLFSFPSIEHPFADLHCLIQKHLSSQPNVAVVVVNSRWMMALAAAVLFLGFVAIVIWVFWTVVFGFDGMKNAIEKPRLAMNLTVREVSSEGRGFGEIIQTVRSNTVEDLLYAKKVLKVRKLDLTFLSSFSSEAFPLSPLITLPSRLSSLEFLFAFFFFLAPRFCDHSVFQCAHLAEGNPEFAGEADPC